MYFIISRRILQLVDCKQTARYNVNKGGATTKTLKALKTATIWNCIFCCSCILSTVCFALNHFYGISLFFSIGVLVMYGWIVNPFGIISCFRCLKVYLSEYKTPGSKQIIGRKWIWIFVWPIVTIAFWLIAGGLFIEFTGGV